MKKEQIIRQADAREYIDFQFRGLAETLEKFDYQGMATMVRAAHSVFNKTAPDEHHTTPDCILLENKSNLK